MVAVLAIVSSLVVAASTVQAGVIPRHHRALSFARSAVPEGWVTDIMESYDEYRTRYLALDCEAKHDTAFFDLCCHPMKSNETLATARDASCDPANASTSVVLSATASATSSSAPAATNVASSGDDDDEDCDDEGDSGNDDDEDCDDDGETTSAAAATSSAHATTKAAATTKAVATTSAAAEPTTTKVTKPATTSAAAKPTTTSQAQVTTTKKATSTKAASSAAATSSASSSDDSGDFITGGKATFFFQEGAAGSCGNVNSDSTPLVAVQQDRMKSSLCGKKVEIINTANGKSVTATIQDTCPGCANANSLDLSTGAFDQIGDEATGVLDIKWKYLD